MNNYLKKIAKFFMLILMVAFFQACSVKIPIDSPIESENSFTSDTKSEQINFIFQNDLGKNHNVSTGKQTEVFILEHNNEKIDGANYIKNALIKEIKARKIPLVFTDDSNKKLHFEHFEIITHRTSGYSPLVTISTLGMSVKDSNEKKKFISVVKRGKVPIWSMGEVSEPCYNEPMTLLVKEIVAKLNQVYFGYKLSDDEVENIKNKITNEKHTKSTYLDVYELGFSNNNKALDFIKNLAVSNDEYIRLAAISSIGILGNSKDFSFLVALNKNSKLWQDRAMALKSIGDLDTKESRDYLIERKSFWQGKTTRDAIWNLKIIDLYIN